MQVNYRPPTSEHARSWEGKHIAVTPGPSIADIMAELNSKLQAMAAVKGSRREQGRKDVSFRAPHRFFTRSSV